MARREASSGFGLFTWRSRAAAPPAALDHGTTVEVANVIWGTGFDNCLDWIDLRVRLSDGEPDHEPGVARGIDIVHCSGQPFVMSVASAMVSGSTAMRSGSRSWRRDDCRAHSRLPFPAPPAACLLATP